MEAGTLPPMASPTERVDFFFDPVCPWAWVTSRFTAEVAGLRDIDVEWRFISLRMVNEQKDYGKDFPPGYVNSHEGGRAMLRVAAAARQHGGDQNGRGDCTPRHAPPD